MNSKVLIECSDCGHVYAGAKILLMNRTSPRTHGWLYGSSLHRSRSFWLVAKIESFGSERLTGALLDRLTHHVHILEMNG